MARNRSLLLPLSLTLFAVPACSAETPSGSSSEVTGWAQQAVTVASVGVNYAHVKGVRQAPGKAGAAPTDAQCRNALASPCYSPQEIQTAYGVSELLGDGYDGKGETIVIVDSFGSPTIAADLKQFDADYGLPDPPSFRVITPLGTVPFDPDNTDMQGWAFESALDVQWAHAMAPAAGIVLLTSPVDETEGTVGLPEFARLLTYALDHKLGHVISQSWSATENTLFDVEGLKVVADFEGIYARAAASGVTVFAAAGDDGSSNQMQDGVTFYPFPTVGYPASSPNVTAVGGTTLMADTRGNYQSEVVWNDSSSGFGAGGGGISQLFRKPAWQARLPSSDQTLLGHHRGLPDVSFNADPLTAISVYISIPGIEAGYYFIGGTSEGSPQWAGIAADFNQRAGRPLGALNPKLYALGATGSLRRVTHDITSGDNAYNGVPGYSATVGWDPASGWGTPKLAALCDALAAVPDDE